MFWRILLYALIIYVPFCAIAFIFQRKLLYLPNDFRLSEERVLEQGLSYWPSVEDYRGFIGSQGSDDVRGTVIVFHGNAGAAYDRDYYVEALSPLGLRVILAEYPGYGGRAGHPSEVELVTDALETIRLAYESYGEPLYVWGESLGGGVGSSAVSQTNVPIQGLVLFLPWDSLPSLAQTHYWFLPARWLVLDRYDNIDNLRQFDGNIAVLLASDDEVIPVQHGQRLYDSLTASKQLWRFENSRHNTVPVAAELPWWKEVIEFIAQQSSVEPPTEEK